MSAGLVLPIQRVLISCHLFILRQRAVSFVTSGAQTSLLPDTKSMDAKTKAAGNPHESVFRNFVTADGSSGFPAARGRYHLYVSLACPYAHRTLVMRKLKGLEDVISCTVVDWLRLDKGWSFTDKKRRCELDTVNNCDYLRDIYYLAQPDYSSRITVPVLWDKVKKTIVNNESSEIIRMLNAEFNEFCATEEQKKLDFYPEDLRSQIDELNSWIKPMINSGVYKAGFAETQEAYDEGVKMVFEGLDRVEAILSEKRYLTGSRFTEADIRLFTSLVRFDMVYVGHFKCNKKRIIDYPNIWPYTRDIYQIPGVADTVDPEHIMKHYQTTHRFINPYGIVAIGPDLDFNQPHSRASMSRL